MGARLKKKLFSGTPGVGEIVRIRGVRFTRSSAPGQEILRHVAYFNCDDESAFMPYPAAADIGMRGMRA